VENLSGFVPSRMADVERTIAEGGVLQFRPSVVPSRASGGNRR